MSADFFRERRRKLRVAAKKKSGTASVTVSAAVAMPPPPPLVAQPGNSTVQRVEEEEGLGDILFAVARELPPMNQYNVQYVREENGTTYMKM